MRQCKKERTRHRESEGERERGGEEKTGRERVQNFTFWVLKLYASL